MPCTEKSDEHRSKIIPSTFGLQAAVARPVGKKEIQQHPKALEAQKSEWERLWDKDVWDWRKNKYQDLDLNHLVQEWTNVAGHNRRKGKEVHMGRLFGIMVEKRI